MLLLSLILAALSYADCDNLKIQKLNHVQLNPSEKHFTQSFSVTSNKGRCSFFLTFSNGHAGTCEGRAIVSGKNSIPIQVCTDAGCVYSWKTLLEYRSNADIISGSLNGTNKSADFNYYIQQKSVDTYAPFGTYEDNYLVSLYEISALGLPILRDTKDISIREQMQKKIDLSLVSTGTPFDSSSTFKIMDFGTLTEGKESSVDFILKYNAGYRISVSSEHAGALQCSSCASTIPYRFIFSGQDIKLGKQNQWISSGAGASPNGGLRFPIRVQIGSLGNASSGNYSDSITFTVTTTE